MTHENPSPNESWIANEILQQLQSRKNDNFELYREFINPGYVQLLQLVGFGRRFVKAQGMELEDDHGERYLDFLSGYGVHNLGHNHPVLKKSLQTIIEQDLPGFTQVECSVLTGLAAEQLVQRLPAGLNRVYFCSSGSEAVDAALKLARAATGRTRLLGCQGAFHGNTLGVLGLMDNPGRQIRFRPLLPDLETIPFGDLQALEMALKWNEVAGFIVEPILGEGGVVTPAADFLPRALELCHNHKTLLIVDEVQTGLGRTGKMWAIDHAGIRPDAICLAKSLGGGLLPVGAMVCAEAAFHKAYGSMRNCLDHKTTFSGGPLAMVAVLATLRVLEQEGLLTNAQRLGHLLKERLVALQHSHRQIKEVRGVGLMLAIQFADISGGLLTHTPFKRLGPATAELFTQYVALRLLQKHRIVTQVAANDLSVLKVMPPLVVTQEQIDYFVTSLEQILSEAGHGQAYAHLAKQLVRHRLIG